MNLGILGGGLAGGQIGVAQGYKGTNASEWWIPYYIVTSCLMSRFPDSCFDNCPCYALFWSNFWWWIQIDGSSVLRVYCCWCRRFNLKKGWIMTNRIKLNNRESTHLVITIVDAITGNWQKMTSWLGKLKFKVIGVRKSMIKNNWAIFNLIFVCYFSAVNHF